MSAAIAHPTRRVAPAAPDPTTPSRLDVLFELDQPGGDTRGGGMPAALADRYAGDLWLPVHAARPTVLANFVSTLDGVVAFGSGELAGGRLISGFHEPDRFVMALLRAVADVVVVGAGTLRGSATHRWTPAHAKPELSDELAAWRLAMGLPAQPATIVVSGSGNLPSGHPGLNDPSVPVVIATSPAGATRLRREALPDHVSVEPLGEGGTLGGADIVALATRLGARVVLSEGGPHLIGALVADDVLDELFLTVAPQLVGRQPERRSLVEGIGLSPADARWQELVSIRRSTDHLFLRYRRAQRRSVEREF